MYKAADVFTSKSDGVKFHVEIVKIEQKKKKKKKKWKGILPYSQSIVVFELLCVLFRPGLFCLRFFFLLVFPFILQFFISIANAFLR